MMGHRQVEQASLFYGFSLEKHVPPDHLRSIDRFVELDEVHLFETVLRRCIRERLVGGEGFAVDASLIKADANRQKGIEGERGLPPEATSRAIDEYVARCCRNTPARRSRARSTKVRATWPGR
jgi:hypothetical protein